MKDTMGFVHLRGMVEAQGTSSGHTMFQLPAGYRPAYATYLPICANGAYARSIYIAASSGGV